MKADTLVSGVPPVDFTLCFRAATSKRALLRRGQKRSARMHSALRTGSLESLRRRLERHGTRPPRHLLPLRPLHQPPIVRGPLHANGPIKIFCIGTFARFGPYWTFAAASLVSQPVQLSPETIACLRDEAYVHLCRQSPTQELTRVEIEKAQVKKTKSSFALFASKKSRLAYQKAMDAVLEAEGEIRQKLIPEVIAELSARYLTSDLDDYRIERAKNPFAFDRAFSFFALPILPVLTHRSATLA